MTDQNKPRPTSMQQNPPAQGVRRPVQRPIQTQGQAAPQGARRPMNPAGMPPQTGQRPMNRPINRPAQTGPMNRPVGTPQQMAPAQRMVQRTPIQNQQAYNYQQTQGVNQPQRNTPPQQTQSIQNQISNPKTMGILAVCTLLFGVLLGAMMFSGSSKPAPQGLLGVVKNDDIRSKLPRCGRIDRGQACILYIMNSTRYDQIAESFFEEALRLTEVPIYSISMANPKYAKRRIPPGHFAEIHIPKVR